LCTGIFVSLKVDEEGREGLTALEQAPQLLSS
jgi:hypothetical protein